MVRKGSDRAITERLFPWQRHVMPSSISSVANINQLAINACLSDAILEAVTKAGNVILDRAMEMVPSGIEKEAFSETGSPAVVILDFATSNDMDLIVMGSRGLGVVKGVLLGSVSQYIVEQSKCLGRSGRNERLTVRDKENSRSGGRPSALLLAAFFVMLLTAPVSIAGRSRRSCAWRSCR